MPRAASSARAVGAVPVVSVVPVLGSAVVAVAVVSADRIQCRKYCRWRRRAV